MTERKNIIEGATITYNGVFDPKGVMKVIKDWSNDKGYFFIDTSHTESLTEGGKFADITLLIFKKLSDYAKSTLNLMVSINHAKDVVVEMDGKKVKLLEGNISFTFYAYLDTDYEGKWEGKAFFYFLRTVFEQYIYAPFLSKFDKQIMDDMGVLKTNLKSYLNLYKFS